MKFRFNKYSIKLSSRLIIWFIVVMIISLTISLVIFVFKTESQYYSLLPDVEKVVKVNKSEKIGLPKQLIIPSINIKVDIEYVGLTSDGAMYVNPSPETVGWYMLGVRPGDEGSAVIAGHYGWDGNGKPAIFNDIQKLNKGDELSVIDQKGQSVTFVVREIRKYEPDSDASEIFKSTDNNRHLNLITCNGTWEDDKQTYSDRLVVFTDAK